MLAIPVAPAVALADYQRRAEDFWQVEVTAQYRAQAGLTAGAELASVYEAHADLFSIDVAQELIDMARSLPDRDYLCLAAFAAMRYLRQVALPCDEAFWEQLGKAMLPWQGGALPFFATTGLLATESDPALRRLLYQERGACVSENNHTLLERWRHIDAAVGLLGYETYYALCDELRGLRLESLELMAQTFLRETAVPYFRALSYWGQMMLGTSQPDAADMFYLLRGHQFDALFPADQLETAVYKTVRQLGFPLGSAAGFAAGLEIDLEPRQGKSPRPFCAFIHVPDEIKLVINPVGGHQDYKAVFHELGHALHGLHISAHLPFTARYLGDDSVGEAFAFVFEQLPTNPFWLKGVLGTFNDSTYVDYMRFTRLLFARRCAAKVLYENQLHLGLSDPAQFYTAVLQEHLGLNISPAYYLLDVDDGFYNAQYFRAWMLAAQITVWLEAQLGREWVCSASTGALLKTLWQRGQPPAEVVSTLVGQRNLNPEALIRSFVA